MLVVLPSCAVEFAQHRCKGRQSMALLCSECPVRMQMQHLAAHSATTTSFFHRVPYDKLLKAPCCCVACQDDAHLTPKQRLASRKEAERRRREMELQLASMDLHR